MMLLLVWLLVAVAILACWNAHEARRWRKAVHAHGYAMAVGDLSRAFADDAMVLLALDMFAEQDPDALWERFEQRVDAAKAGVL